MLDKQIYVDAFRHETEALARAAREGLEAPTPSCPEWTVGLVVVHLTGVYAHRIKIIASRASENIVQSYEDVDLPPKYKELFDEEHDPNGSGKRSSTPPELIPLFERTAAQLADTLAATDPSEPVWTWWPPDRTAGFWMRRMAHETAVHRWDVELAHGHTDPIESNLASDGIDEIFDVMVPLQRGAIPLPWQTTKPRAGVGESYHFHRTDGPGEWLIRFEGDGTTVSHQHDKGDVAIRGSASDLLLFLWGRIPAEQLEVFGDGALLERYFELVPPD